MNNPHQVLGLPPTAGETEIRDRYLKLVREFPPDRAPQRFAEVRAAYESLRDPVARLESQFFSTKSADSVETLHADLSRRLNGVAIPARVLLALAESP